MCSPDCRNHVLEMLDGNKQRVAFLRKTEEALAVAKPQRVNFGNSNGEQSAKRAVLATNPAAFAAYQAPGLEVILKDSTHSSRRALHCSLTSFTAPTS